jgi:hypothetical protein
VFNFSETKDLGQNCISILMFCSTCSLIRYVFDDLRSRCSQKGMFLYLFKHHALKQFAGWGGGGGGGGELHTLLTSAPDWCEWWDPRRCWCTPGEEKSPRHPLNTRRLCGPLSQPACFGANKIVLPFPGIEFRQSAFSAVWWDTDWTVSLFWHCLFRASLPNFSFITQTNTHLTHKIAVLYCFYMFSRHLRHLHWTH